MAKRVGIEWCEDYAGDNNDLKYQNEEAEGFYNTISGTKVFNWGNNLAWDQDFEESGVGSPSAGTDSVWADDVDIVYFCGHGSTWDLHFGNTSHDDGYANANEMSLGDKRLKWLVASCCQVLADNAISRWSRIFNGLRSMFGFRTNADDEGNKGRYFAEYLNDGYSLYSSWKWAAQESHDSDVDWAFLHVSSPTNSHWDEWSDSVSAISSPTDFHHHTGTC
jgi:hypothetical protein